MSKGETLERVAAIVAESLGIEAGTSGNFSAIYFAHLGKDLDADSLDMIDIELDIETAFGIEIGDDSALYKSDLTVRQIAEIVDRIIGDQTS